MAEPVPIPASEAAPERGRNLRRACDLFQLFSGACDHAAREALAKNVALNLLFDPGLRAHRSVQALDASAGVRAMIAAMLQPADRGALLVRAGIGPDGREVAITVSGPFHPGLRPDPALFRQAAACARALDCQLEFGQGDGRLILSMAFPAPPASPSVLLIEADWPARQESVDRLNASGFEVDTATNGEAARRILAGGAPMAVLIDLYMEDEDALALCGRLKVPGGPPILALTQPGCAISGWALAQAGFSGALESPVDPRVLQTAVETASVEAAELETVQAGEDAEEDGDDQDSDHGVLRSAAG